MLNLSIFIKGLNPNADYYRQQVGERGILEQIDNINEGFLEIKDMEPKLINEIYKILDLIETSLTLNVNDPRTRMALKSFKLESEKKPEKEPEKKLVENTEEDLKKPDTENIKGTDPAEVYGEPGSEGEAPTGEPDPTEKVDTTELAGSIPGEPGFTEKVDTTEPVGEPDPAENIEGPTDETPEPAEKKEDGGVMEKTEPTPETPEPKKGGRKKKDAE